MTDPRPERSATCLDCGHGWQTPEEEIKRCPKCHRGRVTWGEASPLFQLPDEPGQQAARPWDGWA